MRPRLQRRQLCARLHAEGSGGSGAGPGGLVERGQRQGVWGGSAAPRGCTQTGGQDGPKHLGNVSGSGGRGLGLHVGRSVRGSWDWLLEGVNQADPGLRGVRPSPRALCTERRVGSVHVHETSPAPLYGTRSHAERERPGSLLLCSGQPAYRDFPPTVRNYTNS